MMGFTEKRVKMAAWLLFIVFVIVYMFHADKAYHVLSGKSYAVKLPGDLSLHAKGDLPWHFLKLRIVKTKFREMVVLNGKVTEIANKSGNAKVRVFFRSPDDLYEVIGSRHSFSADSMEIAVNLFVSTSGLDRGVYQIGLYLFDDAGKRFVWTNNFFNKITGGPVEYIARPVTLVPTRVSKDLKFVIEKIDNESKEFLLQGWMVLDNAEMKDYNAHIVLKDPGAVAKAFYAPLFTRMDVASMYDDARAANSGFWIRVSHHDFAPGKHVITVMIKSRKTGEVIESEQAEIRKF